MELPAALQRIDFQFRRNLKSSNANERRLESFAKDKVLKHNSELPFNASEQEISPFPILKALRGFFVFQVPLPYISKQLGHSTNKVTLDTYIHLMPKSAQLGDSLLENLYEEKGDELKEANVRMYGT